MDANGHLILGPTTTVDVNAGIVAGRKYHLVLTRAGAVLSVYLDGAQIYSASNSGWEKNETATYYTLGRSSNWGWLARACFHECSLWNLCLSPAEVLELFNFGVPYRYRWGDATGLVKGNDATFASDTGWWTRAAGSSITGGVSQWTAVAGGAAGLERDTLLVADKAYRCAYTVLGYSAGGVQAQFGGTAGTIRNGNGAFNETIIAGSANAHALWVASGTSTLQIDNLTLKPVGALVDLDFTSTVGLQVTDRSGGINQHALLGGLNNDLTRPRRWGQVRGRTSTNGNQQLCGGTCLPVNARIDSLVVSSDNSGTPVTSVSVGNASGGAQLVNAAAIAAGRNDLTAFVSRFSTTGAVWIAANGTSNLDWTVTLDLTD